MDSSKHWFESVAEAQRRAKKRLPRSVYLALIAGSERGVTLGDNVAAFDELRFRPHIAALPAERAQATSVLGQDIALPVVISPTGVQAVHPDGEVAVARANPAVFFQMYWVGSRDPWYSGWSGPGGPGRMR